MKTYRERLQDMISLRHDSKRKFHNVMNLEGYKVRGNRLLGDFDKRMRSLVLPLRKRLDTGVVFQENMHSLHDGKAAFSSMHSPDVTLSSRSLEGTKQTLYSSQILEKPQIRSVDGLQRNFTEDPIFAEAGVSDIETTEVCTDAARETATLHGRNLELTFHESKNELERYRSEVEALESKSARSKAVGSNLQEGPLFSIKSFKHTREARSVPVWRELYDQAQKRNPTVTVDSKAKDLEAHLNALQLTRKDVWETAQRKKLDLEKLEKETVADAFTALSIEAQKAVDSALYSNDRNKILVTHEKTNIDITGAVIQCLLPGAWLNDEVINLYMQLLKERELLEPKKFLKCHFFNTFFYNKLFKDKGSYDYKAVRRWTMEKKLGYSLLDCDKILVPIHKDIHWCLSVINIREKKIEYLDSLKGIDDKVLQVLAKYIVDEAKDKKGELLDVDSWEHVHCHDIPEQLNGCDCGMFMVKYADFHSRGAKFNFTQSDMEYFRRRTAWEILKLRAS